MLALHLTESKNIKSIMLRGLLPSKVRLYEHLESFNKRGLRGDLIIYSWEDCNDNNKYAKDMIFCKQWINPRNVIVEKKEYNFSKDKSKYFFNNIYSLLLINFDLINEEGFFNRYTHEQSPVEDKYNALFNMNCRFAHDDKKLCLFFNKINPSNIKIVGSYIADVDKNNQLLIRNN